MLRLPAVLHWKEKQKVSSDWNLCFHFVHSKMSLVQNRVMLILHAGHCGKQVSNAVMALRIIVDSAYV